MNLLIFENEFPQLQSCFDALEVIYFNNLKYTVCVKSQDFPDFKKANDFDFIFVDINLTDKSTMDGFEIIQKLISENIPKEKICVLTGWVNIKEELQYKGITDVAYLTKPVIIEDLYNKLKHLYNS